LAKKLRLREQVVHEIVVSEIAYIYDIKIIIEVYLIPMREKNILKKEQLAVLFSNVEVLRSLNIQFLKDLEKRIRSPPPECERVGDIFLVMMEYFKMYTAYCSNQSAAMELLNEVSRNSKVAAFLKAAQMDPLCKGLDLSAYIIKPVQRVCKYPLLLREVLKYTPPEHIDYADLSKAESKINGVVGCINEGKRFQEQLQLIPEIEASISGLKGLVGEPARRFLCEADWMVKMAGYESKSQPLHLFLFNDRLILTRTKGKGKYDLVDQVCVNRYFSVNNVNDYDDVRNGFQVAYPGRNWIIHGQPAEVTQDWLSKLNNRMLERRK